MKKIFALVLALMMVLSLAACGGKTDPAPSGNDTSDPGTQQTDPGTNEPNDKDDKTPAASTDYFYDHYDFCEEWMMPDDGVYTSYRYVSPDSNSAGNEMVVVRIEDITEEEIEAYIQKLEDNGYTNLISDSYSKATDSGTAMIEIGNYLGDGYIEIRIDPSI